VKHHPERGHAARWAAGAVLVALAACSSPTESVYPSITGSYGGPGFNGPVQFDITYRTPDGIETQVNVSGTFIVATQVESHWTVDVYRYGFRPGMVTGEVSADGAIQFTLTQPQWGDCATADVVSYTGSARSGGLNASGRGTVRCDDGTVLDVEESLHGRLPPPPPPPSP